MGPSQQTSPQPRGMANTRGVTCYLNSAMQALAACPALVHSMREGSSVLDLPGAHSNRNRELASAFASVLEQLMQPSSRPIRADELVRASHSLTQAFQDHGQQDAQEFLCALLDALHEEHSRPLCETELMDLRARTSARWHECTGEEWRDEAQLAYEVRLPLPQHADTCLAASARSALPPRPLPSPLSPLPCLSWPITLVYSPPLSVNPASAAVRASLRARVRRRSRRHARRS
jgi:hypothetical protein